MEIIIFPRLTNNKKIGYGFLEILEKINSKLKNYKLLNFGHPKDCNTLI